MGAARSWCSAAARLLRGAVRAACLALEILAALSPLRAVLKGLTMVLFVYVGTGAQRARGLGAAHCVALLPRFDLDPDYVVTVVAVFGTTISPYVFFWQAAEEVEDMHLTPSPRTRCAPDAGAAPTCAHRRRHRCRHGLLHRSPPASCSPPPPRCTRRAITDITTSAQAAEALRPLAGPFTFFLFAAGSSAPGLLAVPVLAGSAAYGVSEALGWRSSLELAPREARASTPSSPARRSSAR